MSERTTHHILTRCFLVSLVSLLIISCASKKHALTDAAHTSLDTSAGLSPEMQRLVLLKKIHDNQVYTKNIAGNISFSLKADGKNISMPGAIHMRKDEVIRLQIFIPLLGSEVGRLEFTPDHVLIVDRIHKEYVQADYNQVSFLRENGITFYTLQALFWNQLLIPGLKTVSESALESFSADILADGDNTPVVLKNGNITYTWSAEKTSGRIVEADIRYHSSKHGTSSLNWQYANFTPVGVKMFPSQQTFTLNTSATKRNHTATVNIKMNDIKTTGKWDSKTTVSPRYKKIQTDDILKNIIDF